MVACQNFVETNLFLYLWGDKPLRGVIFINALSLLHFFRNSQHPEKGNVSLRISSGNVNASGVVTC